MSDITQHSNGAPEAPSSCKTSKPRKFGIPCWLILKPHRFDGDTSYTPARRGLAMKRRCSACGLNVKGGEILLKE